MSHAKQLLSNLPRFHREWVELQARLTYTAPEELLQKWHDLLNVPELDPRERVFGAKDIAAILGLSVNGLYMRRQSDPATKGESISPAA